uniref:Small cardioactive peptide n=1 Tax=Theba pisana TaxID=145622 RepID=A0A0S1RS84_9EUPU|nr:small cardioactive peptide [Theba pisana]
MEVSVSRTSLFAAVLILMVCGAEAMNYLAFPRMGRSTRTKTDLPRFFILPRRQGPPKNIILPRRGYLAFPRMGRSQGQSAAVEGVASCCGLGLKSEFVIGQNGKEELDVVCAAPAGCCEGLREIVEQSSTGTSYSLCVPDSLFHQDTKESKAETLRKFKVLTRM